MVASLPLPPPQVPLTRPDSPGKTTQPGYEFLDRLQRLTKALAAVTNIFNNLTATASTALLDVFTSALNGLVPASGGGTAKFLRADVSWAVPPLGGMSLVGSAAASSGTTASIINIPACKALLVGYRNISHDNGANQTLRFALSTNNGGSYGTPQNMFSTALGAGVSGSGVLTIMRMDQTSVFIFQASFLAQILGGVEATTSGTVNAIQFSWSAGNFDDPSGGFFVYALT